jgi:hypothetical protein
VYDALLLTCYLAFLAGVPIILIQRASRPQRMPWWLVVVLSAALYWIIRNIHAYVETHAIEAWDEEFRRQHPYALIDHWRATDPPIELRWGWAFGLGYLALCLGPYWLLRTIARRFRKNRSGALSFGHHGIVAVLSLVFCLFAAANYYVGLGLFGRLDTATYVFSVAALLVYAFAFASMRSNKQNEEPGSNNRRRAP